jgi:hypothetical protein
VRNTTRNIRRARLRSAMLGEVGRGERRAVRRGRVLG